MPHWKSMVSSESENLHHFDLFESSPVAVKIVGHRMKIVKSQDGERNMLFLQFKGASKELGINVTNGQIIEALHGTPDPDKWIGKTVTLRCALCKGDDCIRLDAPSGMKFSKATPKFTYTDKKNETKTEEK